MLAALEARPTGVRVLVTTAYHALLSARDGRALYAGLRERRRGIALWARDPALLRAHYRMGPRPPISRCATILTRRVSALSRRRPGARRVGSRGGAAQANMATRPAFGPRALYLFWRRKLVLDDALAQNLRRDRRPRARSAPCRRRGRDRRPRPRLGPGARDAHPRRARDPPRSLAPRAAPLAGSAPLAQRLLALAGANVRATGSQPRICRRTKICFFFGRGRDRVHVILRALVRVLFIRHQPHRHHLDGPAGPSSALSAILGRGRAAPGPRRCAAARRAALRRR